MYKRIIVVVTVLASALLLTTCGGKRPVVQGLCAPEASLSPGSSSDGSGGQPQYGVAPPIQAAIDTSLDDALAELDALETPDGVDAELFAELKDALHEALDQRFSPLIPNPSSLTTAKLVATPPTGEANRVDDLELIDDGGTYSLTWHYRNLGDYDQNGTVGIADITPLAMHYSETYTLTDDNCLLAVIDGSGNGTVDIADITPIAMYYSTDCASYLVQGQTALGAWTDISIVPFSLAQTEAGRLQFSYDMSALTHDFYRVAPHDAYELEGVRSAMVPESASQPPNILGLSPHGGTSGESVVLNAAVEGTAPLSYAWNFGGGATPNISSSVSPIVTLGSPGDYNASLTVTNNYGEDTYPFTLRVSTAPAEAVKWHVMVFVAADNNLWAATVYDILSQEDFTSNNSVQVSLAYDINAESAGGDRAAGIFFVGEDASHDLELNGATFNSASTQALTQYLNWVKTNYPAEKHMLILYDHGDSWTKNSSGILVDDTSNPGRQMEIEDLAEVISQSGLSVEVLTFRACLMASIEVIADLDDVVDYVVASQTVQTGGDGAASYPFTELVTWLQQNPSSSARDVAIKNTDLYAQKFSGMEGKSTASSSLDCAKVPSLISSMASLRSALSTVVSSRRDEILDAMEASWRFVTGDGDLGSFLDQLDLRLSEPAVQSAIDNVRSKLSQVVIRNELHYETEDEMTGDIRGCEGINIYLPIGWEYDAEHASQYQTLSFAVETGWDDLLDQLNGSNPNLITDGGEMLGVVGWYPELADGGPEIDLYVVEPTGDPEWVFISSPAWGIESLNGYLSPDSWYTGYSWEAWTAKSLIYKGPYIFAASYYCDGWEWIGCDVAFVGSLRGVEDILGPYYLDSEEVYEPELGPGWIIFATYDRSVSSLGGFRQCTLREAGLTDAQISHAKDRLSELQREKQHSRIPSSGNAVSN